MPDGKDEKKSADGSSRWWEFYAVRYAMGTVVGAAMLYFVLSLTPALRPLLFEGVVPTRATFTPLQQLGTLQLSVLVVAGLVYCYIASAPILVLHAGRFLLGTGKGSRWWWALVSIPVVVATGFCWSAGLTVKAPFGQWLVVLAAFGVITVQYAVAALTLGNPGAMFDFYVKLAAARSEATGGILDSYRHLREHGNSFFIVLLEVLLGLLMLVVGTTGGAAMDSVRPYLLLSLLVVWILPAVLVWAAATLLEREFSQRSTGAVGASRSV